MNRFLNFELLANPLNWVIVALMLAFFTMALAYIAQSSASPGYAENTL